MTNRCHIIAIDGPAASGKGTLSRALAKTLNFAHMDTGALYRAVAYEVLQQGGCPENAEDAMNGCRVLAKKIASYESHPLENPDLRLDKVGNAASKVAEIQAVRDRLLGLQRDFAKSPPKGIHGDYDGAVLDGRDIGTVVCPNADLKLYVTADLNMRAQRRQKELQSKGLDVTYSTVLEDMRVRDARDSGRETAPLTAAHDAFVIDTSHKDAAKVLCDVLEIVQKRLDR